jgi:hypothetical protein
MAAFEDHVAVPQRTVTELTDGADIASGIRVQVFGNAKVRFKAVATGGSAPTNAAGFDGGLTLENWQAADEGDLSKAVTVARVYAWCEDSNAIVSVSHD